MKKLILLLSVLGFVVIGVFGVKAEENCGNDLGCIERQIADLNKSLSASQNATRPLEEELTSLSKKINSIQSQVNKIISNLDNLEKSVEERSVKVVSSYKLLSVKLREMYKRVRTDPGFRGLIRGNLVTERQQLKLRQETSANDKQLITTLVTEIGQLEEDKRRVESEKKRLSEVQKDLNSKKDFLAQEVKKAKTYQSDLNSKIAQLSAKQQEILNAKQGSFQISVGDVPLADDPNSRPDYNPGFSPAFAAFSFGVPHFKGMSQYGALGRAKSGQNAETILKAYYNNIEIKKDYDAGKQISVSGYGRMDIETYVKRVYEVPNSWGDNGGFEALKAQAVAARSYALAWTNEGNGGAICTTESCQVYKNSNKGGKWEEAVNATRGWVLWNNNKPFKAWFASTSGGYQLGYTDTYSGFSTIGIWDAVGGRSGWTSQAYEKIGGSPWFYKAWYKDRDGTSCGRSHPWLTAEEMADILNAWFVIKNTSDERVSPIGSCWGGNPYSLSELRQKADSFGGGYEKVNSISGVVYSDGGVTASIKFDTNKGVMEISGADFKKAFNLRAPGRISIKSNLFNIEKK